MKKLLVGILFIFIQSSYAETPEFLSNALDSYIEKGSNHFLPELVKGSAMEHEKSVIAQGNLISQIEAFFGKPQSWEVLAVCKITKRIGATYYTLYHENGPVYGYVYSYLMKNGSEVATKFQFHTEPEQILPYFPIQKENICDYD